MKMPASFAEFSDALQKARIKDGSFCKNELTCIHYNGLTHAMIGWNANLYDLNLFAQRLASLTEEQKKGMDALLKIKQNHRVAPIPLNQLINLTYNTDICCFAPRVSNHEELGAFLYANEMLSNEAMALLDTTEEGSGFQERLLELLGEQHQEDHGGVFTDFGYAELGGEIKDIYVCQSNETACFHRSDAPVVLEVRKGFFNDPSYDNDKTAVLNLPAADAGIWRAVEKVDAASVDECAFRCVDCLIPFLRDAINNAIDDEDGIEQADEFAKRLAQIEREWPESDMVKYKALLSVVDHPSLQDATRLMGEIDQYELRPEVAQTWGYNEVQARELIDCLREIAPYVVIDCGSYIANDILSAVALMEADSVLRLANADLKSISYLSSQLPLLRDAKWDTDKQYKTASNVKSQQAGDHMSQALGTVAFTLPHSAELEGQYLAGNLLADLSMKDSRVFRKEIEKIAREVFGC